MELTNQELFWVAVAMLPQGSKRRVRLERMQEESELCLVCGYIDQGDPVHKVHGEKVLEYLRELEAGLKVCCAAYPNCHNDPGGYVLIGGPEEIRFCSDFCRLSLMNPKKYKKLLAQTPKEGEVENFEKKLKKIPLKAIKKAVGETEQREGIDVPTSITEKDRESVIKYLLVVRSVESGAWDWINHPDRLYANITKIEGLTIYGHVFYDDQEDFEEVEIDLTFSGD